MALNQTINLDHQASTPLDPEVLEAIFEEFQANPGNPHSDSHVLGWKASASVDKAAQHLCSMLSADPDEIIFTSGATEANNLAIIGMGMKARKTKRQRILVSSIDHKCVLEAAAYLQTEFGFHIDEVPVSHQGIVDLDAYEETLDSDVLLVSIGVVNSEIGSIQPIQEIAERAREHGAYIHTDAAQAPIAIDMTQIAEHVDMISLSAHKMYGPKGIGALYINRGVKPDVCPQIYGGGQQGGMRSGTLPTPLCVGFGRAAEIIQRPEFASKQEQLSKLRDILWRELNSRHENLKLNGPGLKERHPGNLNILFEGADARQMLSSMQPHVAASMGSACASGIPEPSYVLRCIGLNEEQANGSLRLSLGFGTTASDVTQAIDIISGVYEDLAED